MTWTLDNAHTKVGFDVRHMMISKVHGSFKDFEVELTFDPENLENTTIKAQIDAQSIDTNQADRDAHLHSKDFFNVEEHPTLVFESTSFKKTGGDKVELVGDLTIRGVTKPVTLKGKQLGPVKNPFTSQTTIGYSLKGAINRDDFGLNWNQALEAGGVLVGKEINLTIEAEVMQA